ncbi:MAG: hypothetical protein KJ799_16390 [Bacteroidetes bacterium]|nr:hypothetical protein [Bacteroidota bacterium]MBU1679159.1 hypothetical protein [Bacteroidota bacterium]MBU2508279.1 hypothetical protein [Bacteroidota bacterium]
MKFRRISLSILSILYVLGCASTKITSFIDPAYQLANFKNILIIVNTSNLEDRKNIENTMVKYFLSKGRSATESYKVFPPTRNFTDEEKIEILLKNKIDAFIAISIGEYGVSEYYIPQTSSVTKTTGNVNVYGGSATYNTKSKTSYEGGYTLRKPWAEIETKMYDVSNGQMTWIATSFNGGNAYANKSTVIESYCEATVNKLIEDRMVKWTNQKK